MRKMWLKYLSSLAVVLLFLSLMQPAFAATDERSVSVKPSVGDEKVLQKKAAIAEQLNLLQQKPALHPDIQGKSGDELVNVIVQFSEPSIALVKGMKELQGKTFSAAEVNQTRTKVITQQQHFEKSLSQKQIMFKKGYSFSEVVNGMALSVKASDLNSLLSIPGVVYVEPDVEVVAFNDNSSNEPTFETAMSTSVPFLGVEALWNKGIQGQGIKVGVIDTGIDYLHPELKDVYKGGVNFVPHTNSADYARPRAADDPYETTPLDKPAGKPDINANGNEYWTSHGTHVSGTIAAVGNNSHGIKGLAPKVELYAYRVLGAYGSGQNSWVIAGIDKAVQEGMDVINLSLGSATNSSTTTDAIAINNAMLAGVVAVVATGNDGPNRGTIGSPSTAQLSIAVGNSTNPETTYKATVTVEAGSYKKESVISVMGWTFGSDLATVLNGNYDLVAVPNFGEAKDYAGLDVKGKVALVSRGSIAFVDKIAAAKNAEAKAILVHNAAGNTGPANVFLGDAFEFIPTFDMSTEEGLALRDALSKNAGKVSFKNFVSQKTSGDLMNSSSSRGPANPNFDIKPDVVAPGTNIMSTVAKYGKDYPGVSYGEAFERYTGTSMATPHIAGIAALLVQMHPEWDAFDVKVALSNTAKVLDTKSFDVFDQGPGRVQPVEAANTEALAYVQETYGTAPTQKGTVSFGKLPEVASKQVIVTKQIVVENLKKTASDYTVTVETTKAAKGAQANTTVKVDKTNFSLTDKQVLNVTLTAPAGTTSSGNEILGYIHITNGTTNISLPFAADFSGTPTSGVGEYYLTEYDLSFNGDGIKDAGKLEFELFENVLTNYIELWDISDPEGGEYGDGYIGYLHAANSLAAGAYYLDIKGQYRPWGGGSGVATIPDGIYTVDFSALTTKGVVIDSWDGPLFVKSSAGKIFADVQGNSVDGYIEDSYIDWNSTLDLYDLGYDLNTKLFTNYTVTNSNDEVVSEGPITLGQDGSFSFELPNAPKGQYTLAIDLEDAAGNNATKSIEYEVTKEPETSLVVDQTAVTLKVDETAQLAVKYVVDGEETDVTADATYVSADEDVATVEAGLVTAVAEGSTTITVSYEDQVVEVAVEVSDETNPEPVTQLVVDKTDVALKIDETAQLAVKYVVDGVETDATANATYASADEEVATVEGGLITAKAEGETTISISYEGETATVNVVVSDGTTDPEPVADLEVTPKSLNMKVGDQSSLSVKVIPAVVSDEVTALENTDVAAEAEYSSYDSKVVTVDKGKVTAVGEGTTEITVAYQGLTAKVAVKVEKKVVTPPPSSGGGGGSTPPPANPNHVVVDASHVSSQAQDPNAKSIEIKTPEPTKEKPEVNVEFTTAAFNAIEKADKPVVIKAGNTELSIPSSVLGSISALTPGKVTITIKLVDEKVDLSVSGVYEFSIAYEKDGKKTKLTDFVEAVDVTIPVNNDVKDARKVAAYYKNDTTTAFEYLGGKVGNGKLTFKTTHFSKFVALENLKSFKDIQTHWAKDEIEVLASRTIISGKNAEEFNADGQITRAEFAVLIARALNLPLVEYEGIFKDVTTSKAWAYAGVEAAYRAGIVNGKSAEKFDPDAKITREEIATMIIRAIEYKDAELLKDVDTSKVFKDESDLGTFAKDKVKQAAALGIVSGRTDGTFKPKATATRAEAAVMIYRALDKLGEF